MYIRGQLLPGERLHLAGAPGGGAAGLWVGDALPDAHHLRHQHPHYHRSVSSYYTALTLFHQLDLSPE